MNNYILTRLATIEDSMLIYNWRNDPTTRIMSINQNHISVHDHNKWFLDAINNPGILIYLGLLASKEIGVCRFNVSIDMSYADISLNLSPYYRGMGLSAPLLSATLESFRSQYAMPIIATIKKSNMASIKSFTKCNFILLCENSEYIQYIRY
jgi:RimJ/RimL family protein N-acetyltransferase